MATFFTSWNIGALAIFAEAKHVVTLYYGDEQRVLQASEADASIFLLF